MTTDPAAAEKDEGAVAAFSKAIDLNPDFETAYRNRSQALRKLGRMAQAQSDLDRSDPNPDRGREEPVDYTVAGLVNLFPGFGLGYLVLHRRTQFKFSIATWFLLTLFGIFIGWTVVGLSGLFESRLALLLYVGIPALISWSLVAAITASHLLIAAMTRNWEVQGAWSRLGAIMGVPAVLIGSLIYLFVVGVMVFGCATDYC